MTAYARHNLRHLGVGQQYPEGLGDSSRRSSPLDGGVRGGGESAQRKYSSTRRAPRETLPGLRRTKTSTDAAAARHWLGQQANERNRGIRSRAPQRRCSAIEDRRTWQPLALE